MKVLLSIPLEGPDGTNHLDSQVAIAFFGHCCDRFWRVFRGWKKAIPTGSIQAVCRDVGVSRGTPYKACIGPAVFSLRV